MNTMYGYALAQSPIVLDDDSTLTTFRWTSDTANSAVTWAYNRPVDPPSYTFTTNLDQSMKIFSGQCNRVSNYIYGQLELLDNSNDDQNETVVDCIASVIDLMGEPASYTAVFEARVLKENVSVFEPLLLAIATARHKETEAARIQVLRRFANDSNYRVKRAAVRALGRMNAAAAKNALTEISGQNSGEIALLAAASLR